MNALNNPMPRENPAKLRELVLHLAQRSEGDVHFGMTKLNKLLFFSDFLAYAKFGRSITGATYMRLPKGPVVRGLPDFISGLVDEGVCARQVRDRFEYKQNRVVALRDADLSDFSGDEIALVENVLSSLQDLNAASVSDLSHTLTAWRAFKDYDDIPYQTVFVTDRELTDAERDYALELVPSGAPC